MNWADREYRLTAVVTVDAPHGEVEGRTDLGVVKYGHWDKVRDGEWGKGRFLWHEAGHHWGDEDDDRVRAEFVIGTAVRVRYEYEPVVPLTDADREDIRRSLADAQARLRETVMKQAERYAAAYRSKSTSGPTTNPE